MEFWPFLLAHFSNSLRGQESSSPPFYFIYLIIFTFMDFNFWFLQMQYFVFRKVLVIFLFFVFYFIIKRSLLMVNNPKYYLLMLILNLPFYIRIFLHFVGHHLFLIILVKKNCKKIFFLNFFCLNKGKILLL